MPVITSQQASHQPRVMDSLDETRRYILEARRSGKRVGLIPTMGALHEGHLSLVDAARASCDFVAATIFANPTQFAPHEDLAKYPRTFADDLARLAERQVDLVFAPREQQMYPPGYSTYVLPPRVAERWEGAIRPGHFQGVATVVLKLFQIVPADVAFFGQKDFQQTCVIRRMVEDFHLPVEIRVCPTVRDPDGLALSSRNRYLLADERARAIGLYRSLQVGVARIGEGERQPSIVERRMREELERHAIHDIDYVGIADPDTLEPLPTIRLPIVLLVAARLGGTRLIDNWLLTDGTASSAHDAPVKS
jgi:pantoate--beta-alanine ligase